MKNHHNKEMKRKWSIFVGLIGMGMLIFGMLRGEVSEVFSKAVNICLECIGIG